METALIDNMNTIEEIKKAGWAEVERQQKELARLKDDRSSMGKLFYSELAGRIQGMVYILNMIK